MGLTSYVTQALPHTCCSQAMRRNWPRTPLVGASLAIARLWLEKARKRRAFWKHVAGVVQHNQSSECLVCRCRAGQQDRTLATSLAKDGKADPYALDRLISGFEVGLASYPLACDCMVHLRDQRSAVTCLGQFRPIPKACGPPSATRDLAGALHSSARRALHD